MSEITYKGEPLYPSHDDHWTMHLNLTEEQYEDMKATRWQFESMVATMSFTGELSLTDEQKRTGWMEFTSSDGLTGKVAVGWRAEKMAQEAEVARQAAMAACPYVECTCGYHED